MQVYIVSIIDWIEEKNIYSTEGFAFQVWREGVEIKGFLIF